MGWKTAIRKERIVEEVGWPGGDSKEMVVGSGRALSHLPFLSPLEKLSARGGSLEAF